MTDRNNLAVAFYDHVQADPGATALVIGDRRWSRGDIAEMAASAVGTLERLGARPGDLVVAQYGTLASDVAIAVAAAQMGCTFVPIPHRLGAYEMNYILSLSSPILLALHDLDLRGSLEIPPGTTVLTSHEVTSGPAKNVPFRDTPPGVASLIGFTSGSTGRPKGVMHTWASMAWTTAFLAEMFSMTSGEAICVTGAGAGAPGFTFYTYLGLSRGLTIVAAEKWDPIEVIRLMAREECVWSTMVPTMLYMMLEAKNSDPHLPELGSMRGISVGGAFMTEDLIRRSRQELGLEVLRVYAMAECMMACQMRLTDTIAKRDTLDGWPGPGTEVSVFDNDLVTRSAPGEVGEFGFRGPSLFMGYLGDPDAKSSRSTPDGFFLSGDMGRITDDGYIKVVGRKKDLIIRGGFNIDPVEVEELIRKRDDVRDVAVVGFPDEKFGERACAFLLVPESVEVTLAVLTRSLLEFGLSKEKLPERVVCVTEFPRSPDGKILKGDLRTRLINELASLEVDR